MTTTPRIISESLKDKLKEETHKYLYDMSNPGIFGPEFYRMSFKEAIDKEILVDYQIVAIGVEEKELEDAIRQRKYISENETIDEIANNYALEKVMQKHQATHAVTFHSSVTKAKAFQKRHQKIYGEINTYHVNGELSTNERSIRMKSFENSSKSIITNARCLTEGVDVPSIDVVYFCDPKNSKIDIVQAAGRALRRADHKGKKFGYIVVPIFHREKEKIEQMIDSSQFKKLIGVVRARYAHDERLVDEIREISIGKGERSVYSEHISINISGSPIVIEGFQEELKNQIFDQLVSKVAFRWKDFKDARHFVQGLHLKSRSEWENYTRSSEMPNDIPKSPPQTYKNKGWISWADWLGTTNKAPKNYIFLPFETAKNYVKSLNLKSYNEWAAYSKNPDKPMDIPSNPQQVYKDKGWISWKDWLGTTNKSPMDWAFQSFETARAYVHTLQLKSQAEWLEYCKSGQKPAEIPAKPARSYKNKGWVSLGDWLGTGSIANFNRKFLEFDEARNFVRNLGLTGESEWRSYCRDGKKPDFIPTAPDRTYKEQGWISWGDWLGTGRIADKKKQFLPYEQARQIIQELKISTRESWRQFLKDENRPANIPANPDNVYKNKGWIDWGVWFGTGSVAPRNREYRTYEEAKAFVHSLKLLSQREWNNYCTDSNKPEDIPSSPQVVYKQHWKSWGEWLGTGAVAPQNKEFRSFDDARNFARSLNLKKKEEWVTYAKSGNKPNDIPSSPPQVYENKGWISWGDWLGTNTIASYNRAFLPFEEARAFILTLSLKTKTEWQKYKASGEKPINIPAAPSLTYKKKGWISWPNWLGTKDNDVV